MCSMASVSARSWLPCRGCCGAAPLGLGRRARQRPAPRILDATELMPAHAPMPSAIALRRRQQQGAQAGEAVGADPAGGHQFAERVLQLGTQQIGWHRAARRRTARPVRAVHRPRPARATTAGSPAIVAGGNGRPDGHVASRQQHDRRAAHRAAATAAAGAQARPADSAGAAQLVQPVDRVVLDARRQQSRSPTRRPPPRSLPAAPAWPPAHPVRSAGWLPTRAASRTGSASAHAG